MNQRLLEYLISENLIPRIIKRDPQLAAEVLMHCSVDQLQKNLVVESLDILIQHAPDRMVDILMKYSPEQHREILQESLNYGYNSLTYFMITRFKWSPEILTQILSLILKRGYLSTIDTQIIQQLIQTGACASMKMIDSVIRAHQLAHLQVLMECGQVPQKDLALMTAIEARDISIVNYLLKSGATIPPICKEMAIVRNDGEILRSLIREGVKVHQEDLRFAESIRFPEMASIISEYLNSASESSGFTRIF